MKRSALLRRGTPAAVRASSGEYSPPLFVVPALPRYELSSRRGADMKRPILSLFSGFFWFACSGSQPGPGAEGDGLRTESQFCVEWAKKACNDEVVAACNAASPNDCVATQKSACQVLVPFGYTSENAE